VLVSPASDRNLLFAILALQRGHIRSDQLINALHAWALTPNRRLADFLVEQQALLLPQREEIDRLLIERIGREPSSESAEAALPPRYLAERFHARGGVGEVYYARDVELNRVVALKRLRDEFANDSQARELFQLEAETTGRLEHPGIVPIYGFGTIETGRPYYAMRFIRGETLSDAIHRFHGAGLDPLNPAEKALALRQLVGRLQAVCQTMAYSHDHGVIHRDLKPSNVMLGRFGETLVVDWGLAWPLAELTGEGTGPTLLTSVVWRGRRLAQSAGSPAYMAPEQRANNPDLLGRHTDVYLLGGILYEILTGRPPHPGGRADSPRDPSTVNPAIPLGLAALARRALARSPSERFSSAEELGREIERWLAEEPLVAFRQTLQRVQGLVEQAPDVAEYREEVAHQQVSLGLVLGGMNRLSESETEFRRAIQEYERLATKFPSHARYRSALGAARAHLARILSILGRTDEADRLNAEARTDFEQLLPTSPRDYHVASICFNLPAADSAATPSAPRSPQDTASLATAIPAIDSNSIDKQRVEFFHQSGITVEFPLARGGGSQIYVGHDRTLDRRVAIKTLLFRDSREASARFLREARVMARLEHSNVCPVYAVGENVEGMPFIVMRFIPGQSLRERSRDNEGRLPDSQLLCSMLRALVGVCRGLGHAHRRGVIHRDPKPGNIMMGEDNEGILIDWGLARLTESPDRRNSTAALDEFDPSLTQEGTILGTPSYLPPEMTRGGANKADAHSDVYILGASLFEILTGRPPYRFANVEETLQQIREGTTPRPRQYQPATPLCLDAICARAMAREPAGRYPSADALGDAIESWLNRPTGLAARLWFVMRDAFHQP
jgi:serine/threonine protein kinase